MTPREQIAKLNNNGGFYDTNQQFINLIEARLYNQATKILNSLNDGFLFSNEREIHNIIYNYLLDGISVKQIKTKLKNNI